MRGQNIGTVLGLMFRERETYHFPGNLLFSREADFEPTFPIYGYHNPQAKAASAGTEQDFRSFLSNIPTLRNLLIPKNEHGGT